MIRVIGQPAAAPCATVMRPSARPACVIQATDRPSPLVALLDAGRDLALKQIDVEVLNQPSRYRTTSWLIGHAAVEILYSIARVGIETRPAERH